MVLQNVPKLTQAVQNKLKNNALLLVTVALFSLLGETKGQTIGSFHNAPEDLHVYMRAEQSKLVSLMQSAKDIDENANNIVDTQEKEHYFAVLTSMENLANNIINTQYKCFAGKKSLNELRQVKHSIQKSIQKMRKLVRNASNNSNQVNQYIYTFYCNLLEQIGYTHHLDTATDRSFKDILGSDFLVSPGIDTSRWDHPRINFARNPVCGIDYNLLAERCDSVYQLGTFENDLLAKRLQKYHTHEYVLDRVKKDLDTAGVEYKEYVNDAIKHGPTLVFFQEFHNDTMLNKNYADLLLQCGYAWDFMATEGKNASFHSLEPWLYANNFSSITAGKQDRSQVVYPIDMLSNADVISLQRRDSIELVKKNLMEKYSAYFSYTEMLGSLKDLIGIYASQIRDFNVKIYCENTAVWKRNTDRDSWHIAKDSILFAHDLLQGVINIQEIDSTIKSIDSLSKKWLLNDDEYEKLLLLVDDLSNYFDEKDKFFTEKKGIITDKIIDISMELAEDYVLTNAQSRHRSYAWLYNIRTLILTPDAWVRTGYKKNIIAVTGGGLHGEHCKTYFAGMGFKRLIVIKNDRYKELYKKQYGISF